MKKPPYNHSRHDGPSMPCPTCLALMTRADLIKHVKALTEEIDLLLFARIPRAKKLRAAQ